MNFYLNDEAIEFDIDDRELKFYLNDRPIDFVIPVRQERDQGWILTTGIWNDNAYWNDNAFWRDNN